MLQIAHPEVAQPKLGALRLQVCHCPLAEPRRAPESVRRPLLFANVSHHTRLDTRSKARRPIKVGMKGRGSGTSRGSNPTGLCCSSAHLVQCEPDEPGGFTGPRMGPGTYASLRLKLDARSSAIQGVSKETKMQFGHPEVA